MLLTPADLDVEHQVKERKISGILNLWLGEWVSQSACFKEALHQLILADKKKKNFFFKRLFVFHSKPIFLPCFPTDSLQETQVWGQERQLRD